jgi:hypothetical protein
LAKKSFHQWLNSYLAGKQRPGDIMEERLKNLGCDIHWLRYGETSEEANKKFYEGKIGRGLKYSDEEFEMLDFLKSEGIVTLEQLKALIEVMNISQRSAMMVNEKLTKYKIKKK